MTDSKSAIPRSERKPRHGWFDYEVLDVFGDELGPFGITVYVVLARLCYGGFRVTMGQRELAAHARMSKTELFRTLRRMMDLGLVVEHKGPTPKSVSSYDLMDVKELVEEVRAAVKAKSATVQSGPHRTRSEETLAARPEEELEEGEATNAHDPSGDAALGSQSDWDITTELEPLNVVPGQDTNWSPQDQMPTAEPAAVQNAQNLAGTELQTGPPQDQIWSSPGADLVPQRARLDRQETKKKKGADPTPTPPQGGALSKNPFPLQTAEETQALWAEFIAELKRELHDVPIGVEAAKGWTQIQRGEHDWRACFSAWWIQELERGAESVNL